MNFDAGFGGTPGGESHGGQSEFLLPLSNFRYSFRSTIILTVW